MLSALSGNIVVLNELISQHNVDVNARLQMNLYEYGAEQGATALALAAACAHRTMFTQSSLL